MECAKCSSFCIKAGKQHDGKQRYYCKTCGLYQQKNYVYNAYRHEVREQFSRMNRIGCGANKMALFLRISINTVQRWTSKARLLTPENEIEPGGVYDVDEMQTCVGKKEKKVWITCGWHVEKRLAVAVHVGGRSSEDLKHVTSKLKELLPSKVNTDNYVAYPNLLKGTAHDRGKRKANHIEREHVNMRKDIAGLIRKTMCYAKKVEMLEARLKWYFWGGTNPYFFLEKA